jgi:DeoR family transcriptional regulator of aga operon
LTLSLVGPCAIHTVESYVADRAFFSVKGITPDGHLTEPNPMEAEVKRAMIRRSESSVLLADGRKFELRGSSVIAHIHEVSQVLAADAPESRIVALTEAGVEVRRV